MSIFRNSISPPIKVKNLSKIRVLRIANSKIQFNAELDSTKLKIGHDVEHYDFTVWSAVSS